MESVPIADNNAQTERLSRLVGALTDADMNRRVGPAGYTIAATLAHVGFWDRWAQALVHRWRTGEMPPPHLPQWYDDAINATLLPEWVAMAPATAGRLAVDAAQAVDRELTRVETPVLAAIVAGGESNLLHRHQHRRQHLDEIEAMLAAKQA
jgi:hypothetical protein